MSENKGTSRPLVIAAVMASMFMIAIEATIVSTAMPQIAAELGGLDLYSWVFSAFLLTQTAMTVVFGKLADLYGRKPVILAGIGIFIAASVLAGAAWSMPSMIVFRLLQGVGAGAIQPVGMTIVADLYPAHERGKVQGYLASVWAVSALVGPVAGGLIIHAWSWAWIFWINVPIGLLAAAGFILFLRETVAHQPRSIDYGGAALFTATIAALMVALTVAADGETMRGLLASAVFVVCLVLFVMQERRAEDPMVSFALWRRRSLAAANGATLLAAMALMGLTTFLPMFVQGVLHKSPVVAGLTLTMMVLGWPAGATTAGRIFPVVGLRRIMIVGSLLLPIGAAAFILLTPGSSPWLAGAGSLVMGFGMGLLSLASLVLIQESVDRSQRGSATASNIFARNLGSTLGATVLGAVLNFGLARGGAGVVTSERLRAVLETTPGQAAADSILEAALADALHLTFWAMLVLSLAIVLLTLMVPATDIGRKETEAPGSAPIGAKPGIAGSE